MNGGGNVDPNVAVAAAAGGSMISALVGIVLGLIVIAGMWKIFEKAGKPGWAAIIPIYNAIVLLEIVDKPLWWIVLFIIPIVNIIAAIIVYIELANRFGQGVGFAIGMVLLSFIFIPLLGFGDYQYQGSAGVPRTPAPAYQ